MTADEVAQVIWAGAQGKLPYLTAEICAGKVLYALDQERVPHTYSAAGGSSVPGRVTYTTTRG